VARALRAAPSLLLCSLLCLSQPALADDAAISSETALTAYAAEPEKSPVAPALGAIGAAIDPATATRPIPAAMSDELRLARSTVPIVTSEAGRKCLAMAIYFEARSEPLAGQAAVAQVIINRSRSPRYPDSICEVVYQNKHRPNACQFSFACDGLPETVAEQRSWKQAVQVAADVATGSQRIAEIGSAMFYHATYVSPYWAPSMRQVAHIGAHVFYRG
jgi:spore germination cell wall hydrolase CwlJ-like protein